MTYMNAATRPDYALDGWYTPNGMKWDASYAISREYCKDADGNEAVTYSEKYRNFEYALKLTARWKIAVTVKVVYDLNGGSGNVKNGTLYALNGTVNVTNIRPTPPELQIFVGWKDAAGTLHSPESSFAFANLYLCVEENGKNVMKMTAQYAAEEDVMITFDTDGGTAILPIALNPGQSVTAPANPVKDGFTFSGWTPELPPTMPEQSLTLKAVWTATKYTITFDAGEGADAFSGSSLLESRSDGAEYIVLTAQYEPEPEPANVTITFNTDGGSMVSSISQKPGTAVTKPTNPPRRGYDFGGWTPDIPETMPDADLTVMASWNARPFQITFNTGAGTPVETILRNQPCSRCAYIRSDKRISQVNR